MAKQFKLWLHIEEMDLDTGDTCEPDEPVDIACVPTMQEATSISDFVCDYADSIVKIRQEALDMFVNNLSMVVETAGEFLLKLRESPVLKQKLLELVTSDDTCSQCGGKLYFYEEDSARDYCPDCDSKNADGDGDQT